MTIGQFEDWKRSVVVALLPQLEGEDLSRVGKLVVELTMLRSTNQTTTPAKGDPHGRR